MLTVLACDPGATGGFALVRFWEDKDPEILDALPTPLLYVNDRPILDARELRSRFDDWFLSKMVIELVGAMPKQGVTSMFQFGKMYGAADAAMRMLSRGELHYITPQRWKKAMGLTGRTKNGSLELATEIYGPDAAKEYWPRKKDDGGAEAALLAYYIVRMHKD